MVMVVGMRYVYVRYSPTICCQAKNFIAFFIYILDKNLGTPHVYNQYLAVKLKITYTFVLT